MILFPFLIYPSNYLNLFRQWPAFLSALSSLTLALPAPNLFPPLS